MSSTMITVFVRLIQPYFVYLLITAHLGNDYTCKHQIHRKAKDGQTLRFLTEGKNTAQMQTKGPFHIYPSVRVMLIIEDPTVTVKCRTEIKALLLNINMCLSVQLHILSCSFTSISFLTY